MSYIIKICLLSLLLTISVEFSYSTIRRHQVTTTTTTATPESSNKHLWIENTIPKLPNDCKKSFLCKKKVKHGDGIIKPCIKYCVKDIECPPNTIGKPETIQPDWCILLDQNLLDEFDKPETTSAGHHVMPVNMIDFPCQEGYLPDFRGRCREVW
ncbi:uncharacterized protein LOC129914335 [Episyrphus balteatus]|uniref:uncharacterized protein LOC129914335 n=1 Tax=Episyrphus balteatus TaxID=286459 RepID=UPI002485308C|nr:uncharacterized protein LOC129914335 [Episyrphus balteatus]